jgi:HicB family
MLNRMNIERHVQAIQSDLAVAAALGDEASAAAGERLAVAVESSLQLRLLDVLTEATLALNAQLSSGHIEVRLAGRDPELVLVDDRANEADMPPAPGDDLSARITLRLPEALKGQIEVVASREGVSANSWIVRALSRALEPRLGRARSGNRLQGFAQS